MPDTLICAEEYASRHERVAEFLRQRDLGALLVYSMPVEHKWGQTGHVSYLTGWANHDRIVDCAVVVPAAGRPALLFAGLPYMVEQANDVSAIEDIRLVAAVDPNAVAVSKGAGHAGPRDFAGEALAILAENGLQGKGLGVAGLENMPAPFYQALVEGLGAQLKPVDDVVAQLRSVKSPDEVQLMRRAAELSDLGFETMLEVARPGMRGVELIAEMERVVRRCGADHAKYWMASGPPTHWDDSRLDIKPHERVLGEGDLMASCSYVHHKGYWCHGQRTGTLMRPSRHLQELYAMARQCQDAGLAHLRAGVPINQVSKTIREAAATRGYRLEGGRIGHGIGMDYSEQPVPLSEVNDTQLEAGMTCVIHVAYALPGSGKMFVPLGDVCHVGSDGVELLMQFPRTPFVAGV